MPQRAFNKGAAPQQHKQIQVPGPLPPPGHSLLLPFLQQLGHSGKKASKKAGSCCCSQFSSSCECLVWDGGKSPALLTQPAPSTLHTTAGTCRASPSRSDLGFVGCPATPRPFPLPGGHSCLASHHSLMHWKLKKSMKEWTDGSWAKTCLKYSAAFLLLHSSCLLRKITDQQLKQPSSAYAVGTVYT